MKSITEREKRRNPFRMMFVGLTVFTVLTLVAIIGFNNRLRIYHLFNPRLSSPARMTAREISGGRIKLNWTDVDEADGYTVYRYSKPNADYIPIAELSSDSNSFTANYDGSKDYAVRAHRNIMNIEEYSQSYTKSTSTVVLKDMLSIIAHRGDMEAAPENTLAAYRMAAKAGYEIFETDIWETKSGALIVSHANNIKAACGVDMDIKDITYENRMNYPIKYGSNVKKYKKQYLPTLEEAVKAAATYNVKLYLHIKNAKMTDSGLDELINTVERYGMRKKTVILTSNSDMLERLSWYDCYSAFLSIPQNEADIYDTIDFARNMRARVVFFKYCDFLSAKLVKIAHDSNIKIGCYDANTNESAFKLVDIGVDLLVANNKFFLNYEV